MLTNQHVYMCITGKGFTPLFILTMRVIAALSLVCFVVMAYNDTLDLLALVLLVVSIVSFSVSNYNDTLEV